MKNRIFSRVILGTVLVFGSFMLSCASAPLVRGDFTNPAEQKEDYAYLSVSEYVQIAAIDGFITSIPMKKNSLLLIPKGQHIIEVQYFDSTDRSVSFSTKNTEISCDVSAGDFYHILGVNSSGRGSITYSITKLEGEQTLKGKKLITAFSMPKDSPWAYHNIDKSKITSLEGTWIMDDLTIKDGRSMGYKGYKGNLESAKEDDVFFVVNFSGNSFVYWNNNTFGIKIQAEKVWRSGVFEFTDKTITLNLFSETFAAANPRRMWEGIGWFIQEDIIGKHKTEKWDYILDGDTLTLINLFMGNRAVFKRQ
jgi:hypothetical protein